MTGMHSLRPSQILVLCRDDKEVVAGMGQSASVHEVQTYSPKHRAWKICIARLLMPADVPFLTPNEEGMSLRLSTSGDAEVGTLVAADLMFSSYGNGFTIDGRNTVVYELAEFLTKTEPAILTQELP